MMGASDIAAPRAGRAADSTPLEVVRLPAKAAPMLLSAIHTEEEFDWSAQFRRDAVGVSHMREIDRLQEAFEEAGARPTYLVDYPIVASDEAAGKLKEFQDGGRAELGTHLHPWVSPPHEEAVSLHNSYPGNLPAALEQAKLATLTDAFRSRFGRPPATYLAGRYGYGPNTGAILRALGYRIDLSPVANFDYSQDGGPDYSAVGNEPFRDAETPELLRIPHTTGYVGFFARNGRRPTSLASSTLAETRVARSLLSRLGGLSRIRLSPEGFDAGQMIALTRALHAGGVRLFLLSFHSPSIVPGFTPYVRDRDDLTAFMGNLRRYFEFFAKTMNGEFVTPVDAAARLARA